MTSLRRPAVTFLAVLALLAIATACGTPPDPAPVARQVKQYPIETFLDTVSYGGASFSPDGAKILVRSDAGGVDNAYALPVDGGEPVQLTDETDAVRTQSYFPGDERFLFEMDRGGNELDHLYVRELDGSTRDLTPGDGLKANFLDFAPDGTSFFVTTNERDEKYFDLYEYRTDGYARTMLYKNVEGYSIGAVSPDRRYVALGKTRTTNDSDMFLWDRTTKKMAHLSPHEGDANFRIQEFHPDGTHVLYTTNEGSEFTRLAAYFPANDKHHDVFKTDWDILDAAYSHHGTYRVVRINQDARTAVRIFLSEGRKLVALPRMPAADVPSLTLSPDETTIAFYMSRSRNPRDLFVYTIGEGQPTQLTRSLAEEIEPDDLIDPEIVRFESYDGVEIPGILYTPHGASAENRRPALVWVHGGPGGQSRVGYSEVVQYLVNHGYVVYMVNNRGSSGYGKTFYAMDDRKHGEADLGDVVASKQLLIDTGYVDPERIGIIGGSYGGYMVLAALAYAPDEFAVGVDIFGVANWVRTLESIPPWWESFREALYAELGDPAVDGERLRRISPLFHAGNITKPLLVLQGANDPRVLKVESDEMVAAVEANGVPVEYVVFDDEGHGFSKKENRREGWKKVMEFLDSHL